MDRIKLMDSNLANKIAAGEVVESIHSVVKELVENSIDANAKKIRIALMDAGFKQISILDDGIGMSNTDVKIAFLRHATSKIYELDDLWNINTLGFRGEALPSIASVAKVECLTSDGKDSTLVYLEEGKIIKETKGELRRGTKIVIDALFYNTPARLKHLKSTHRELADVVNYVTKMALAYPSIKWELVNDDKVLLKTDGSDNLLKVINDVYGVNTARKMLAFNAEDDDYEVNGYISLPEVYKTSRQQITLIVNGRNVRSNELIRAILDAYHTYLPDGKVPLVVLNINTDPRLIDVNIHPAKLEIKFSKLEELKDLIFNTIRKTLNNKLLIPEVKAISTDDTSIIGEEDSDYQLTMDFVNTKPEPEVIKLPFMSVKGFVKGTYIVAEDENNMYLIDQHAANERVNYEKYLKAMSEPSSNGIGLLIPVMIELTKGEYLVLEKNFNVISKLGIEHEEFGENTIIIKSHPFWIPTGYGEEALRKIIDLVVMYDGDFSLEKFIDQVAALVSCKLSIKANQSITIAEAEELIDSLRNTNNPYTCPHGRPVIIAYSNYELEKLFKRVM